MSEKQSCLSLVTALSLCLVMLSSQGHASIAPSVSFDAQHFSKSTLEPLSYAELKRFSSWLTKQLEEKKHNKALLKQKQRLLEAKLKAYTQADKAH